mgnify:CR=1 FL=1
MLWAEYWEDWQKLSFLLHLKLISLPVKPDETNISEALSELKGKFDIVFGYINGTWISYNPDRPEFLNSLNNMTTDLGYWIQMTEPSQLYISGAVPHDKSIELKEGWNLISYPLLEPKNASQIFQEIADDIDIVFEYDSFEPGNLWNSYVPERPEFLNNLQIMKPGYGYWVKAEEESTINFDT